MGEINIPPATKTGFHQWSPEDTIRPTECPYLKKALPAPRFVMEYLFTEEPLEFHL